MGEWKRVEECRTVSVCIVFEIEQEKGTRNFLLANGYFCFSRFFVSIKFHFSRTLIFVIFNGS